MANFTALAAARHEVLRRAGMGRRTARPRRRAPIRVVAGADRHDTIDRALRFLGIGTDAHRRGAVDDQGRMRADALAVDAGVPTIVCAQAGNVNSGAVDPLDAIIDRAHERGRVGHVDGAFGLWAAASPRCAAACAASSGPTRGPPTRTSGSTSRTTRVWCSAPTRRRTGPR
jgi:glutamate/tyrosine decarboxylase-like PLP-dependent enzyme